MSTVVILDLDLTLVHTLPDAVRDDVETFRTRAGVVHVRPGARAFLDHVFSKSSFLSVGVWTAGTAAYAREVVEGLGIRDRLSILLSRDDAVYLPTGHYVKNLDIVRMRLNAKHVVLLDDSPIHSLVTTNDVIRVPPFDARAKTEDVFFVNLVRASAFVASDVVSPVPVRHMAHDAATF